MGEKQDIVCLSAILMNSARNCLSVIHLREQYKKYLVSSKLKLLFSVSDWYKCFLEITTVCTTDQS